MDKVQSIGGMSLIVPFLNEADGIEIFCREIDSYASQLSFDVELVFVNDGSVDETVEKIEKYDFQNVRIVRIVELSKNFGSHAAIRAGLTKASYDICTWLGSDLQEPLNLISIGYEKITAESYDAVYFEKKTVDVSGSSRLFSRIYSKLMQRYAVKNYSSGGTSTIVFNKKIKKYLNESIEGNSSIMLQIMNAGFMSCSIALDYGKRVTGQSKWTFSKKMKLFIDSFVSFSYLPIRLVSIIGILMFVFGLIIGIVTVINRITNPLVPVGYSTLASLITSGFGITNISLGIIAEYLWRTFDAARQRPVFLISEVIQVKGMNND